MKENVLAIGKSLAVLCACTILCSLVFSALYYFQVISQTTFHTLNWLFGFVSFLVAGSILALFIKKKALLHAFVVLVVFLILALFLLKDVTLINLLEFISKLIAYLAGCLFITVKRKD